MKTTGTGDSILTIMHLQALEHQYNVEFFP